MVSLFFLFPNAMILNCDLDLLCSVGGRDAARQNSPLLGAFKRQPVANICTAKKTWLSTEEKR